jgi:Flp pilus assembly protein TadG
MAEMALVLPVFFLLCWGFILLSFILFGYCSATYAAKVAVRYAAVHGGSSPSPCSSSDLTAIAKQYLWGVPANGTTVAPSWASGSSSIGSFVTVTITIVYPTGIPFSTLHSVTIGTTATETILE